MEEQDPREGDALREEAGSSAPPAPSPQTSAREAIAIALVVTLATTVMLAFAFNPERAGEPSVLGAIGGLYVVLGAAALYRMFTRGELAQQMRPRTGDLALGAATAALMYGVTMAVHLAVTGPSSPRVGWIMRLYLQIGDPSTEAQQLIVSVAVFLIAGLEEIAWRGLVLPAIAAPLDQPRAWLITTLLYAAAHIPTCFLLADTTAGLNPLVVAAALGCGLVWGRIAIRTQRLVPAIFAHALFSWAIVEFPIWRP